jgi:hypothetical protein
MKVSSVSQYFPAGDGEHSQRTSACLSRLLFVFSKNSVPAELNAAHVDVPGPAGVDWRITADDEGDALADATTASTPSAAATTDRAWFQENSISSLRHPATPSVSKNNTAAARG